VTSAPRTHPVPACRPLEGVAVAGKTSVDGIRGELPRLHASVNGKPAT